MDGSNSCDFWDMQESLGLSIWVTSIKIIFVLFFIDFSFFLDQLTVSFEHMGDVYDTHLNVWFQIKLRKYLKT